MGTEIVGEAAYRGTSHRIKLHLDGKELTLRDGLKLTNPLKDVRNAVEAAAKASSVAALAAHPCHCRKLNPASK